MTVDRRDKRKREIKQEDSGMCDLVHRYGNTCHFVCAPFIWMVSTALNRSSVCGLSANVYSTAF